MDSLEKWFENCGSWSSRHDISELRNGFFSNSNPPAEEVKQLNSAQAYPP